MTRPGDPSRPVDLAPARLDGRTVLVTGGAGGIGFETTRALVALGATVIMASRDPAKGAAARRRLDDVPGGGSARFAPLDLGRLRSVRALADACGPIDILVNNAAIMGVPRRELTVDGFERQFGTNYLGHWALTALLLPRLLAAPGGGRVVQVASLAHRGATLDGADPADERRYRPFRAYGRSKLAMLMFALELERRARRAGAPLRSLAAHPGWARTNLLVDGPARGSRRPVVALFRLGFDAFAQSAADGARPIVAAAAAPNAPGGAYLGPDGAGERRGRPGPSRIAPAATDEAASRRLWDLSARLTGIDMAWNGFGEHAA